MHVVIRRDVSALRATGVAVDAGSLSSLYGKSGPIGVWRSRAGVPMDMHASVM
jgi:hypothetical protein